MGNFIKQFFDIKFWKFILVGILNTVVGMGLQFLFFNLCGWNEWVSSLIGYILGSILSYFLNKYFTFKNKDKGWKPIVKFALNMLRTCLRNCNSAHQYALYGKQLDNVRLEC
jgi:putative flippase GtrA